VPIFVFFFHLSKSRAIQWLVASPLIKTSEERKTEFKSLAQAAIHKFAPIVAKLVVSTAAADVRINGVHCIKKVCCYLKMCLIMT
jgi:hypothetical protein